jgi:hypothetical protein
MKKSHWIIVVIVIAIVIGVAIGVYFSEQPKLADAEPKKDQGKLDAINQKLKAIEDRIASEVKALQLTTEMELALNRKVDKICIFLGILLWAMIGSTTWLFYFNGYDFVTAVLNTAGLLSLTFPLISILIWKSVSFDSVVEKTRIQLKRWLCKKYGHNPDAIQTLNDSIESSKVETHGLVSAQNGVS